MLIWSVPLNSTMSRFFYRRGWHVCITNACSLLDTIVTFLGFGHGAAGGACPARILLIIDAQNRCTLKNVTSFT